jgi:hypothetical protein
MISEILRDLRKVINGLHNKIKCKKLFAAKDCSSTS